MKMIPQTIDPQQFVQKTRRIRARVSKVLTKWGLLPRFKRWRLTQDPDTGMIVLFGILNNQYIATRTSIPFNDYFDPRVLHDLANELQVQVVSCNSDGLRYAFILDRGQLGKLPTHIDYPFLDGNRLVVGVIYNNDPVPGWISPPATPTPSAGVGVVDDHVLVSQGVGAFLKVFDDIKLRDEAALQPSVQGLPKIVLIDKEKFNQRVAEYETNRQRSTRIRNLFDETTG
jgi:hypothetical protein